MCTVSPSDDDGSAFAGPPHSRRRMALLEKLDDCLMEVLDENVEGDVLVSHTVLWVHTRSMLRALESEADTTPPGQCPPLGWSDAATWLLPQVAQKELRCLVALSTMGEKNFARRLRLYEVWVVMAAALAGVDAMRACLKRVRNLNVKTLGYYALVLSEDGSDSEEENEIDDGIEVVRDDLLASWALAIDSLRDVQMEHGERFKLYRTVRKQ
jgi:hypothetical protein